MIRRLLSAVLLMVFLFNLGGYYLLFSALQIKASRELSAQLDEGQYSEEETFEVNLPLSLPYPIQGAGFERSKQFFTIGGEHYQVVKHKFENDVLTIVCVKDQRSKDLAGLIRSMDEQQSGDEDQALSKLLQDFLATDVRILSSDPGWSRVISANALTVSAFTDWTSAVFSPPRQA